MARSRAVLAPLAALACVAALFNSYSFVAPRQASIPAAAITAAVVPAAAQAAVDMPEMDMGSSLNLSATVEALMLGIVMGTVPITVFGLFVSAWLQFKKGPTLGI
ncbi:petG [Symbiodinium natans]|uniref:PetG protein n=1 Tax=Symbiodinium natans TaxID=878477 RepID=A0A812PQ02_9DINO|nr:petG [Symbiodinium natans]